MLKPRVCICKRYGAQKSIPPGNVAWRAGTTNRVILLGRQVTQAGEFDSLESFPGLLKRLQIRPLVLGMSTAKEEAISLKLRFSSFLENSENPYNRLNVVWGLGFD